MHNTSNKCSAVMQSCGVPEADPAPRDRDRASWTEPRNSVVAASCDTIASLQLYRGLWQRLRPTPPLVALLLLPLPPDSPHIMFRVAVQAWRRGVTVISGKPRPMLYGLHFGGLLEQGEPSNDTKL